MKIKYDRDFTTAKKQRPVDESDPTPEQALLPARKPKIRVFEGYLQNKELTKEASNISNWMQKNLNLLYGDTDFYLVDLEGLSEIVAKGGWKARPDHWSLGQEFEVQRKGHSMGNWIVYEIVASTGVWKKGHVEPNSAYIYNVNNMTDVKLVMAHVFGHMHVDHNNAYARKFRPISPFGYMNFQQERYQELEDLVGEDAVDEIRDVASILNTLTDFYEDLPKRDLQAIANMDKENPLTFLDDVLNNSKKMRERVVKARSEHKKTQHPPKRTYNVLEFVAHYSTKLEDWQREVLLLENGITRFDYRIENLKVLHEGFSASVDLLYAMNNNLPIGETIDWIKHRTNGMLHPREGLNPYRIGLDLLMHVIEKWGSGRFGLDYELDEKASRRNLNIDFNSLDFKKGWNKVLEIAATHIDYSLFEEYFTPEFFAEKARDLMVYEENKSRWWWWNPEAQITSREFDDVKRALLFGKYNMGLPRIAVSAGGGDFNGQGGLHLVHDVKTVLNMGLEPRQVTLQPYLTNQSLKALYQVWGKPVFLETIDENNNHIRMIYSDGKFSEIQKNSAKQNGWR